MTRGTLTTSSMLAFGGVFLALAVMGSLLFPIAGGPAVAAVAPTVTAVSPTSGTVAGGTAITISGSGFTGATQIAIGDDTVIVGAGGATLVDDTTITWTTPVRANMARTAGAQLVTVTTINGTSTNPVYFSYRPVLDFAGIPVGATNQGLVTLGSLAVASQTKPVTTTTTAPFIRSGTWSPGTTNTGVYSYLTDYYYNPAGTCSSGDLPALTIGGVSYPAKSCAAYLNESDERAVDGDWTTTKSNTASFATRSNVLELTSSGRCQANAGAGTNLKTASEPTFCSVFGPQVISESFYATQGQSLSFDWGAKRVNDDYEIYGFLVQVSSLADTVSADDTHTVVAHSVGKYTGTAAAPEWRTSTAAIPADGYYRFRFVNGSYDGTGGLLLGSVMYIDPTISVGLTNTITFPNPGSQTATFTGSVAASSGSPVTVTSSTPNVCTVAGVTASQVTVTRTGPGTCILTATQGAVGPYAPASPVTVSFEFSAAPGPTPPAPTDPCLIPGAPRNVTGAPGDGQVAVSWRAPAGPCISQIRYEAVASPGGQTCSIDVPALTCTITGLTNGTAYTFQVRARSVLGWGPASTASSAVTPQADCPEVAITLSEGTRTAAGRRDRMRTSGTTTCIPEGTRLTPSIRYSGRPSFTQGKATILVQADGTFRWTRLIKKSKGITAYVSWQDVNSNRQFWARIR